MILKLNCLSPFPLLDGNRVSLAISLHAENVRFMTEKKFYAGELLLFICFVHCLQMGRKTYVNMSSMTRRVCLLLDKYS